MTSNGPLRKMPSSANALSGIIYEIGPYIGHYDFGWLLTYSY